MPLDSSPPQTYAGDNSVLHFMKRIKQKNHE
ncbi:hypothetical protein T05_8773 [Trichinella murrelli]|uniref:Uncharacterized protein n=1 Tax=Trichinella murrelli TaxID=144512 RepID=A0A0V0SQR6_9BILA|nr:hypothetical protein T05_8773 [Trichinella murrelli]